MRPDWILRVKENLDLPLPGWEAQRQLIPEGRLPHEDQGDYHPASVLIALYHKDSEWVFPVIRRTEDGFAHSGQIALPGGRQDGDESLQETAVREAWEEIGLPDQGVEILGELSSLPIPVSKYRVYPFVAFIKDVPDLVPEPKEVDEIFEIKVSDLCEGNIRFEKRSFGKQEWNIPYYDIQDLKIWGATSMILSEFSAILRRDQS